MDTASNFYKGNIKCFKELPRFSCEKRLFDISIRNKLKNACYFLINFNWTLKSPLTITLKQYTVVIYDDSMETIQQLTCLATCN